MLRHLLPLSAWSLVACGAPVTPEPSADEPQGCVCNPDRSYTIPDAQPGDVYLACADERAQTTVTTGGEVRGFWEDGCLTITVVSVELGANEIVVQLRGAGGKPMCADAFERL